MRSGQREGPGRRERNKHHTRTTLAQAALRLFAERGYDEVTVAEIAAAAGVSTRTFFGYYPSKADVLFTGAGQRLAVIGGLLAEQAAAGAPPIAALRAALTSLLSTTGDDLFGPNRSLRVQLILDRADLRERATHLVLAAQHQIVAHLVRAYPDQLDEDHAVVLVGGLLGALLAAIGHAIAHDHSPQRIHDTVDRVFTLVERAAAQP